MRSGTLVFAAAALAFAASPVTAMQRESNPQPMNVRLTFQIIGANGPAADEPEIRAVVTELRKLFRFEGYHLLASSILHATAWPSSNVQQQVADDQGRRFAIDAEVQSNGPGIRLVVRLMEGSALLINAAVNLENGKTVVLGTATVPSTARSGPGGDAAASTYRAYVGHLWRTHSGRSNNWQTDQYFRRATQVAWNRAIARGGETWFSWIQGQTDDNAAIILVVTPTINP